VEVEMINDVVLEGIVVRAWKYADDLLSRLACYRIPDLPQKPLDEVQDAADFVTIHTMKGNLSAPVVDKNYHVWVHGFLQSSDYELLFSILDGLRQESNTRLWIEQLEAQENDYDAEADYGHIGTGVEILLPMSHNTLTNAEEYIQWCIYD
jgi:hypothetical protein